MSRHFLKKFAPSFLSDKNIRIILLVIFFFSGFSALVYQIIWIRKFGLVFGVHVFAISTVLTAFMAGLALGSLYFGKLVDRHKNPPGVFFLLQLGIGIFAILFPLLFNGFTQVYSWVIQHLASGIYLTSLLKFLFSFFFLLIPTTLMGGTLPVISKFFVNRLKDLGWNVGSLYAVNNLGAVLGCFVAGFLLMETVGLVTSLYIAACLNILNAVIVLLLSKRFIPSWHENKDAENRQLNQPEKYESIDSPGDYPLPVVRVVLLAFAIEGFTTLAYEVTWTRILLGFSFDKSVYFYSTVIISFIFGLSLGSVLISRWIDRCKDLLTLFGGIEIVIGLAAMVILPIFVWLSRILEQMRSGYGESWWRYLGQEYLLFFLVMLVPTMLMGTTFPIVSKIYTHNLKKLGDRIGKIGFLDTVGSILGSFAAGFILIPMLGVVKAVILTAILNLGIGILVILVHPVRKIRLKWIICFGMVLASGLAYFGVPSNQYFQYWQTHKPEDRLLFYQEGIDATVAVPQHVNGIKDLAINGSVTAFTEYEDIRVHKMLGYLPYLLCPEPERALVIGLGLGITAQSLIQPDLKKVDCVEICSEVVHAAATCFSQENHNVLQQPELNLIIDDGRSHLFMTKLKYDIITSNAVHARLSSNLYTEDFYRLCRAKLTEKGVMCQWLSTNWLLESEYKMLIKAFMNVFPHTSLWCVNPGHVLLIGTATPLRIDFLFLQEKLTKNKIRQDLAPMELDDPFSLLAQFVGTGHDLEKYIGNVPAHTDNHPYAEFSRVVSKARNPHIIESIVQQKRDPGEIIFNTGENTRDFTDAKEKLAAYNYAEKLFIQYELVNTFMQQPDVAIMFLQNAIRLKPGDYRFREELANFYYRQGMYEKAAVEMEKAIELQPGFAAAYEHLGIIYFDSKFYEMAVKNFQSAIALAPENPLSQYYLAQIYGMQLNVEKVIEKLNKVVELYPNFASAYYDLGRIYSAQKKYKDARAQFRYYLKLRPEDKQVRAQMQALEKL